MERLNQTFESRLPADLRKAGVTTIEQANEFLKSYLNIILGLTAERVIDTGHSIKFKNSYYLSCDENGNTLTFKKGTRTRKPYIPPANHPWKLASYLKFSEKQKQKEKGQKVG